MTDHLHQGINVRLDNIAPIYYPLITEIFQRGVDEDTEFPAVFDYREVSKQNQETQLLISFIITKTKSGLHTVKIVKGKKRQQELKKLQKSSDAG